MITKNPFEGKLEVSDLFPSPSQMVHGDSRVVRRAFTIIFMALDISRSIYGRKWIPETWAIAYLAATYGIHGDEEDVQSIDGIANDIRILGPTPQDIRLYSIATKMEKAKSMSTEPDKFNERVSIGLKLLINQQKEQVDESCSECWAPVRDAFAAFDVIRGTAKSPGFILPVTVPCLVKVKEFCMTIYGEQGWEMTEAEDWGFYANRLWDEVVKVTFPYVGMADDIEESSHEDFDKGDELRDHRLKKAKELADRIPEGFDYALLDAMKEPFLECALFDGEEGRDNRDLILRDEWNSSKYRKQHQGLMKSLMATPVVTCMPRPAFDEMLTDGRFRSFWELPEEKWDDRYCDRPQDARAMNDRRLFGEKGGQVVYAITILKVESEETVAANTSHLGETYGGGQPVMVQFRPSITRRASICLGDSFQNFVLAPFSNETLAWLMEAAQFMQMIYRSEMGPSLAGSISGTNSLWMSYMQLMSGQRNPYYEVQVHGEVTPKDITRAHEAKEDGSLKDLTSKVKSS